MDYSEQGCSEREGRRRILHTQLLNKLKVSPYTCDCIVTDSEPSPKANSLVGLPKGSALVVPVAYLNETINKMMENEE